MDCSTPGSPVLHCLLKFTQIHVHWVGGAIQLSHPLSPLSPPALNLSQHSGSFPVSWLFASGSQSITALASASVLPMNIQGWFSLGLTSLISLLSKGPLRVFFSNHSLKASILWQSAFFMVQLSHPYMTTGKTVALTTQTFVGKETSLLFNNQSRVGIVFLPRSKCLLISWLQSPSTVILESKKIKSVTVSTFSYWFAMKWCHGPWC